MSNEEMIKKMVNRFLAWKLPTDLIPDGGITYKKIEGFSPIGTNLLTATQAEAMVRHMLGHGQYCECGCVDVEGDKNQEQVSDLVTNYPDLKGTLIKSDILTITNPPSDPKRKANT